MHCFTLLRFLSGLAASASLLLVFSGSAAGQDWPVFGGNAMRNAVIADGDGPTDWDVASGQNIKWRVSLGSETFAAPVVAGGRVYIGTNNGERPAATPPPRPSCNFTEWRSGHS